MSFFNWTLTHHWNSSLMPEPPLEGKLLSEALGLGYSPGQVFLLNRPVQCLVIALTIITAVVCNVLVIHNIWMCQLKMRTVNFLLIKNLCIVDLIGACVVLPVPLLATAKGVWDFGAAMCKANSTVNIALWFQHILMFAMLKIDRVLASCLPFGKYPIFSVEVVSVIVGISWFVSFTVAAGVTTIFNSSYEPAIVLCIPELPVEFFITIFSIYCAALLAMVGGYILVMLYLRRKRAEIRSYQGIEVADYSALQHSALTSFLITISHFLMYVPTMLVIGLHGWFLHPIAILICDMVVYAEFLIHPIVLLSTSTKMRKEILHSIKLCIHDFSALWKAEFPSCLKHKSLVYAVPPHQDPNHAESFMDNGMPKNEGQKSPRQNFIQDGSLEAEKSQNSDHQKDFSGIVDVDFHRPETPDLDETKTRPIKSLGSCSHIPSRFRSHGRSISREDCNNKDSLNEGQSSLTLCRRHASLPTMSSGVVSDGGHDKRHSVAVGYDFPIMTSNFMSYLLSIGSPKSGAVQKSTEIAYEYKEEHRLSVDSDNLVAAELLSEPVFYRLEQSQERDNVISSDPKDQRDEDCRASDEDSANLKDMFFERKKSRDI